MSSAQARNIETEPLSTACPNVQLLHVTAEEWDRILCGFADATYEQCRLLIGQIWGGDRLRHVILRKDGQVVAAAQVVVFALPAFRRGLAYVKFGPLWRPFGQPCEMENLSLFLDALQEEYALRCGHMLTILPPPDPEFAEVWDTVLKQQGFCQRRAMSDPNRYLVDLSLDMDEQRASLSQKWRYNLKKASRNEIRFVSGEQPEMFEAFRSLHAQMLGRKGFDENGGLPAIPGMIETLPAPARPQIFLGYSRGTPTVGAVVGRMGETATYLYGATDERALGLRAGYALQWHILEQQTQSGARWYDLGGEANEPGLRQFKKGLVGRRGQMLHMAGEWDYWTSEIGRFAADSLHVLRASRASLRRIRRNAGGK